jgi:hypothetical protein
LGIDLVLLVSSAMEIKGGEKHRAVFSLACLLEEAREDKVQFASVSSNTGKSTGIRIDRGEGKRQVWSIAKNSMDNNLIEVIVKVLKSLSSDFAQSIVKVLARKGSPAVLSKKVVALLEKATGESLDLICHSQIKGIHLF